MDQSLRVLGEARAAVAAAGVEERAADARVRGDAFVDFLDVGPDGVAELGDLVHERDARGEHGVGGVLGDLGGRVAHADDGLGVERERTVELLHDGEGFVGVGADDDAVGPQEVVDGRAFLEELGVADTTSKGWVVCFPAGRSAPWRAVPTGTVDFMTTTTV